MLNRSLKLFTTCAILFTAILPKFAIGDDGASTYKVINSGGESWCVFKALKGQVTISQPRIMGYTPYIWKDKFDEILSLGVIDAMLPDDKKIMTFIVSSVSSKVSKIEVRLQDLSQSNVDIIDAIFRQFDSNVCVQE